MEDVEKNGSAGQNAAPEGNQPGNVNPDSPKNRLLRLVVGIVVITLGIILFQITSDLYQKAEARDAAKKEKLQQAADSARHRLTELESGRPDVQDSESL